MHPQTFISSAENRYARICPDDEPVCRETGRDPSAGKPVVGKIRGRANPRADLTLGFYTALDRSVSYCDAIRSIAVLR